MPDIKECVTKSGAADMAGVTEGAIRAAIRRGEIKSYTTADGRAELITIRSVEAWKAKERKRGPKPKG